MRICAVCVEGMCSLGSRCTPLLCAYYIITRIMAAVRGRSDGIRFKFDLSCIILLLYGGIWLRLLNGLSCNKMVDGYFPNNGGYIKYNKTNNNNFVPYAWMGYAYIYYVVVHNLRSRTRYFIRYAIVIVLLIAEIVWHTDTHIVG